MSYGLVIKFCLQPISCHKHHPGARWLTVYTSIATVKPIVKPTLPCCVNSVDCQVPAVATILYFKL